MARLTALTSGVAVTVALLAIPAAAHEHPSGITDLVTPAVVRVEAVSHVEITLLDHVSQLRHVERSYDFPIGEGTGIVVNPDGAIVTLTRVVKTDEEAVAVTAANKVFAEHHDVKIPQDAKRHSLDDPILDRHLKDCYPPKRSTATCIIDVTTDITIFPNVSPADADGFEAELVRSGSGPDTPAVLMPTARAVGSVGMPTAPLADKVPDQEGAPTSVAGFLGRPGPNVRTTVEIAHLGKGGGAGATGRPFADPEKKADEPVKLGGLADRGMIGAPVIGDKDGHVVGLLIGGGKDARMIGVREITSTLSKAGIAPRRGAIDSAFENALTRYHTKYYTEAAPGFQRVLELYPGNVVAADLLKIALAKRGGPEDAGTKRAAAPASGGVPLWPFIAAASVLFVAAAAGAFLLWRRHRGGERPDDHLPPFVPQQGYDEGANQTVMVRRSLQFPAVPQQQQVLTAQEPAVKFCTACGMRLGQAHRFCGYCGQPAETS
ncbi:MAG TPA: S1C family serine protease [Nonomuraea sp.]|uniref:tetratricopeptide repeat protein n=1 Tax=Nonomuraea sp. NPDC049649 TaxID=3155776 RepID=UPI002CA5E45B|nr:S1C family serine protease [Nonomuraea sp.]